MSLKSLAENVISRNQQRNTDATRGELVRNNAPGNIATELHTVIATAVALKSDPATEGRRRRVAAMLAANPALRIAVVCDGEGDPVPVAIAIRDKAACEVLIPRDRYDGALLLDLIDRHSATVH